MTAWDLASFQRSRRFEAVRDGKALNISQIVAALMPDVDLKKLHPTPSDVLRPDELDALPDATYKPTEEDILSPFLQNE